MLRAELDAIINLFEEPGVKPVTANKQRERMLAVAELCAIHFPGDLVEIGAYRGDTTIRLLQIAEKYDRRVLVVDPWKPGTQNCSGSEHAAFLTATAPWADWLDIVRLSSQDPEAITALAERDVCFAYVDGLHQFTPCLNDIRHVAHCAGIIAVDDIRVFDGVRRAFFQAGTELNRVAAFYDDQGIREGYLLP